MSKYVGAIDQGTTSSRFIVFDQQGAIVAVAQNEHEQIYPKPGWVEHDAAEIWRNTQDVIGEALARGGVRAGDLAAVGITNQRETTVLWDRNTGAPLHNALVWQDTRTADLVAAFARDGGQDRFRARTGLAARDLFQRAQAALAARQRARRAREGRRRRRVVRHDRHVAAVESHGRRGGRRAPDRRHEREPHAAHRSCRRSIGTTSCSRRSTFRARCCRASRRRARATATAQIAGAARRADRRASSAISRRRSSARRASSPGEAKNTYGTGCFMLMNTGTQPVPSTAGLVTTVAYQLGDEPPHYALEGSIAIAGALVQWLRDNLGLIAKSADIEALARQVQDNGDVYFVPAFSGLFAPYWRDTARGVIVGLTRYANRGAHRARGARSRRLSDARRARGDGKGLRHSDQGAARRRRHGRERAADAIPGRSARRAGRAAARHRDDGARRGLCGRARGRLLVEPRRSSCATGASTGAGSPRWRTPERDTLYAAWQKAVQRSFDWVDQAAAEPRRRTRSAGVFSVSSSAR